ncbi:MAG: BamA/TamA family outer membrane protein [Pleurocapsa sp. MO_192.B19]|nr:BamA/TamA family outer membrane protein [Pleurocapsa sp. MO_192.B19]
MSNLQTIAAIQVRYVDRENQPTTGRTKPDMITREFKLQPGDIYDAELAQQGLEGLNDLVIVDRASLSLEPTDQSDRVVMVVTVTESNPFFFAFGGTLQPPTALQGTTRPVTVVAMDNKANGISASFRFGVLNLGGNNQALTLAVEGGEQSFGLDLDYRKFIKHDTGYPVNLFTRSNVEAEFDEGEDNIDLPGGDDPWVNRVGGGVEFFRPITGDWLGALGLNYQLVSVRDGAFTFDLSPVDELGNRLTFSDDGQDELLTLNLVTALDRRNNPSNATQGYRLLLETDQSIPVGDANILYNRLAANYTQYLPLPLFGFTEGDRTLVLNFQGGTIIGDLPTYEAFSLGGSSSVRGYGGGELGTGRSFIQATAEYRFPIFAVNAFQERLDVGGTLFIDYASDLGTGDNVPGEPAVVRDKPGDGFGYGVGLRTATPIGIVKLEFALNDDGDSEVIFKIGDRF